MTDAQIPPDSLACKTCRFFVAAPWDYRSGPKGSIGHAVTERVSGQCRKSNPTRSGPLWPTVSADSWCGRYEVSRFRRIKRPDTACFNRDELIENTQLDDVTRWVD